MTEEAYKDAIYAAQIEGEMIGEARGKAEGEKTKALAIALKALHMGMTIAEASQLTGEAEDEIRKLAQ